MTTPTDRALVLLGLQKLEKEAKELRPLVKPGTYRQERILSVRLDLRVGEDYEARQPCRIPWENIALAALADLSPERQAELLLRAEAGSADAAELKESVEAYFKAKASTMGHCTGKVTGACWLELP